MILSQQLLLNASKSFTRPAYHFLGKETHYRDLLSSISRLSYLYQRDLGSGVRVAFICRNGPSYITTFFALTNIRALSIPIDPDLPPDEMERQLRDSRATHVAATSDTAAHVKEVIQNARLGLPIIEIDKKFGGEYDTSFTPAPDQVPKDTDCILLLKASGGTNKGRFASFTHKQLLHSAQALKGLYHVLPTDRFYTSHGWNHPFFFLHSMLFPVMSGSCVVIDHGLQGVELLDFILKARATRLILTPSSLSKLLSSCKLEEKKLPGVKSATVGLGFLSEESKATLKDFGVKASHCYGQTENTWTIAMEDTQTDPSESTRNVGRGLPGLKYKVMDDQGDEVTGKQKRKGQLAVTGPTVMSGYPDREKETKNAIRGTWLYTGDIVELDGDLDTLSISFIGRKEDYFDLKHAEVALAELDDRMRANPAIEDAAFFYLKNSRDEPVLVCAVVKKTGNPLHEPMIIDYCKSHLLPQFLPQAVVFTDSIPRDTGSNIHYYKLRGQFSGAIG